jgi:molecular chaperone DnaK
VLQGERAMAKDNKTLGRFILSDIPPAPRGVPQIEVTFDIDANGIVNVSALDKGTGKSQKITITSSSGLSEEEIERMMKEAELHAEEDKKRKELVEKRNEADQLVYTVDKTLKDLGDKVAQSEIDKANEKKEKVKKAIESDNIQEIQAAIDELTEVVQQLSVKLYEQAAQQTQQAAGDRKAEGAAGKENVVDADYEVVDEDKKA